MKTTFVTLSVLLALQIALAAALWVESQPGQAKTAPLTSLAKNSVERIRIQQSGQDGKKNKTLKLQHKNNAWHLPGAGGFKADSSRVAQLIDKLTQPPSTLPTARSKQSRQRLNVAKDDYSYDVSLTANGETRHVYIGNSAGPGRVYARGKGESDIYPIQLSQRLLSTKASDWYDRSVPDIPLEQVQTLKLSTFTLKHEKNGWKLTAPKQHKGTLKTGQAAALARRLTHPSFQTVSKNKAPTRYPAFAYTVQTKKDKTIHYRYFSANDKKGKPFFVRSGQPWHYTIQKSALKNLQKTSLKSLLKQKKPEKGKTKEKSGSQKTGKK